MAQVVRQRLDVDLVLLDDAAERRDVGDAGNLQQPGLDDPVFDLTQLPLVWLNGFLMFASFAAIGLAASISFDRLAPAIGVTIAVLLVSYFLEIIGSLWPDAEFLQPYSLFHYLQTRAILIGEADPFAFGLLAAVAAVAIAWALIVFPRRDLAAPA